MTIADTTVLPARFWAKVRVDFETGCWNWIAAKNNKGRAVWSIQSKAVLAYRVSWEAFNGPIPESMTVDHLCGSAVCVNPHHFEIVTRRENSSRGKPKRPLTTAAVVPAPEVAREVRAEGLCRHGHDITAPGAISIRARGERVCVMCNRAAVSASKKRARERAREERSS